MRFQAGFILDGISEIIDERFKEESFFNDTSSDPKINRIKGLLKSISCFNIDVARDFDINYSDIHPVLATINNILTRGLPTRAPLMLEELFVELGLNISKGKKSEYRYHLAENIVEYQEIYELLHLIKPGYDIPRSEYGGQIDSNLEWRFIEKHPVFKQILQSQREFHTLNESVKGNRRFDFTYTIPYFFYSEKNDRYEQKTIVYEVDGSHHLLKEYVLYDTIRDELVKEVNADIIRFSSFEIDRNIKNIADEFDREIFNVFSANFSRDIQQDLKKYYLVLLPFVIARIQKALLEIFIRRKSLNDLSVIRIAAVERDLPGAAIALADLENMFSNLNALVDPDDRFNLPEMRLVLIQQEQWILDERVNLGYETIAFADFHPHEYDFVIDHSILLREGIVKNQYHDLENYFTITSSHYIDTTIAASRIVYCSQSLKYRPLVSRNDDTSYSNIEELTGPITYFLQQIFRKKEFREGQLPIISRALQKLPVIGLLPTGGGKSLTFQIPAFLQPSLTIVVDPIKSLMEDQVRVLRENWIDSAKYANSSLTNAQKNRNIVDFLLAGSQFLFVSPERFVIEEFRNKISKIDYYGLGQSIGYCVIDEVHCVSEWGHDFRYDYLMLGENAQTFAKSKDGRVSLIGLTATASFDVLADIERELKIDSDEVSEAIIMIENTVRPELFFRVVDVTNIADRSNPLLAELNNFEQTYSYYNSAELLEQSQRHHFTNFDERDFCKKDEGGKIIKKDQRLIFEYNPGMLQEKLKPNFSSVIFCAIKGEMQNEQGGYYNNKGVKYIHNALTTHRKSAGYYFGSDLEKEKVAIQESFIGFTTGKIDHMVCTKAFGMGIDKEDIRATFHVNYSSSLESLVQECGRGGRDKKVAVATILASNRTYCVFDIIRIKDIDRAKNNIFTPFEIVIITYSLVQYKNESDRYVAREFKSSEEALKFALSIEYSFTAKNGKQFTLSPDKVVQMHKLLVENIDTILQFKSEDRDIHDFFYNMNYKGMDFEHSHAFNLFYKAEFEKNDYEQLSLKEEFENAKATEFTYHLKFSNNYGNQHLDIVRQYLNLNLLANQLKKSSQDILIGIDNVFKYATNLDEFWFKMDGDRYVVYSTLDEKIKKQLEKAFLRNRGDIETGRMIYRLHSVGFLKSYTKDYNKKIYTCVFNKYNSINEYLLALEKFLRRYQSEQTVKSSLSEIESRLHHQPSRLVDDIIHLLWYIAEFSYLEIATKRKRATTEIKGILESILADEKGLTEFEKNIYLKEEIYYYFNAKYARPAYFENDMECSLLDDYKRYQSGTKNPEDLLFKFLDKELLKRGTEQNNYKHLIGSCKKILFSLTEADLQKDWVLRLLNAFALYSSNNISYRSDANKIVEIGFHKLFEDDYYHSGNYNHIQNIFTSYFESLVENLDHDNQVMMDIDLIKNKILQSLQLKAVEDLLNKFYHQEA
ncbi:DEAD/DEAH box helicase [Pedobacter aquatilis]|uniref:DEAD/DEAH box helicase n=1 Tax=Pedobacter aquatilis TaxID=351343 RepID=UPI00292CCEA6|nr:DEAD/DEAH box helicase [Pedobacter aquatilis]